MSPFHFGRCKTDAHRTSCALSQKAVKCPVLRHLDYRLGRGIRKIPDCASTSGTLLIASRTLPTIPVFLFLCPNSTLFPKWGKIRQITSLIRSKIVVKIGVSYYSPKGGVIVKRCIIIFRFYVSTFIPTNSRLCNSLSEINTFNELSYLISNIFWGMCI